MAERADSLNADCRSAKIDRAALEHALRSEEADLFRAVNTRPHLFSDVALFISATQMKQMREVVAAVERVVATAGWRNAVLTGASTESRAKGVFMGYDFHLNADGAHLIEINTNAGGAFLNALLLHSQCDVAMPGTGSAQENLEQVFIEMFRNEWRLERGDALLQTVAIVDEQPQQQYLYPEFLLAQRMFEQAGIKAIIADPAAFESRGGGLYCGGRKIDLIYNRLTDFTLQQHPALLAAYAGGQLVMTPNPQLHALYADKRNLTRLCDADALIAMHETVDSVAVLLAGIPQTVIVEGDADKWWAERKQWFFKPASGYGGKAAYRGDKITRRVFDEIMQADYVAQKFAAPGERIVCVEGEVAVSLKSDVRCYVYDGQIQLVAARLYQGQTTNFRTPGGGFAPVRIVG